MKFRDNLLHLRQQRNMTQEQLAMLLGVSRQSVAKWEAGQSTPEVDKLMKMAELFGCSLDELVSSDLTDREVASVEILPADAPAQDVCGYDQHIHDFAWHIAAGVGCIIMGVAVMVLLTALGITSDLVLVAVFAGVLSGLALILPAAIEHAAFAKAHPFVEDFYTEDQRVRVRKLFTRSLIVGIGLIFLGIVCVCVMESLAYGTDEASSAAMLVCIAVGVMSIVHGSILYGLTNVENYNRERANEKWEREHPRCDRICSVIMLSATAIALLALFLGMAGSSEGMPHAGAMVTFFWIAWPIGGILCAIVTAAMRPNGKL